jgi:hypothetical protein
LKLLRRSPRLRKLALAAHVRGIGELDERGVMYVHEGGCVGVAAVGNGTAHVADGALRQPDVSAAALAPYERARRHAFAPGERVQHLVEFVVSRPPLLRGVAGRFARRPSLADALIAVTGDMKPVRSLLGPQLLAQWVL